MMKKEDCVFCNVVSGAEQVSVIWSDENHFAIHSDLPGTEGHTLVVAKKHVRRFRFDTPAKEMAELIHASKAVGKILELNGKVVQAGLVMESSDVDHVHARLVPYVCNLDRIRTCLSHQ